MPDCEDAPMDTVQPRCSHSMEYLVLIESGLLDLRNGDDPVLSVGSFGDDQIRSGARVGHIPTKAPGRPIRPPNGAKGLAKG